MNKEKRVNIMLAACMIVGAVIMAVVSWNILPAEVATQFSGLDTGAPSVPKFVAVALPFGITTLFAIYGISYRKQLLVGLVGYALNILFWLSNM